LEKPKGYPAAVSLCRPPGMGGKQTLNNKISVSVGRPWRTRRGGRARARRAGRRGGRARGAVTACSSSWQEYKEGISLQLCTSFEDEYRWGARATSRTSRWGACSARSSGSWGTRAAAAAMAGGCSWACLFRIRAVASGAGRAVGGAHAASATEARSEFFAAKGSEAVVLLD
jgi:hypothetical protein